MAKLTIAALKSTKAKKRRAKTDSMASLTHETVERVNFNKFMKADKVSMALVLDSVIDKEVHYLTIASIPEYLPDLATLQK